MTNFERLIGILVSNCFESLVLDYVYYNPYSGICTVKFKDAPTIFKPLKDLMYVVEGSRKNVELVSSLYADMLAANQGYDSNDNTIIPTQTAYTKPLDYFTVFTDNSDSNDANPEFDGKYNFFKKDPN